MFRVFHKTYPYWKRIVLYLNFAVIHVFSIWGLVHLETLLSPCLVSIQVPL